MTRNELLSEVLKRLGDTSSQMILTIDALYDLVLADMAARGALSSLRKITTGTFTTNTELYSTTTLLGLVPYDVLMIFIPSLGLPDGILEKVSVERYMAQRTLQGAATTGLPVMWTFWPNEDTLAFWPTPSVTYNTVAFSMWHVTAPIPIISSAQITEVRTEDLHTLVAGIYKFAAAYFDNDSPEMKQIDVGMYATQYEQGLQVMAARSRSRLRTARQGLAEQLLAARAQAIAGGSQ
jgi:hypothetical protein